MIKIWETRKDRLQKVGVKILWDDEDYNEFLIYDGKAVWFLSFYVNEDWLGEVYKFLIKKPDSFDPEKFSHTLRYEGVSKSTDEYEYEHQWERDFWRGFGLNDGEWYEWEKHEVEIED